MSAVKKVLVPTDFSEASKAALRYACDLATATNASLCVLHAVESPYSAGLPEHCTMPHEYLKQLERSARRELEKLLDEVLTPEESKQFRVSLVLRTGGAAREILRYLQEHPNVDLVVMATHGRGGVRRLMMGSIADKIVRAANCPVLTMRLPNVESTKTGKAA